MRLFLFLFLAICAPFVAQAQMSIEEPTGGNIGPVSFGDSVRLQQLNQFYDTDAGRRHQKMLVRQERNTIEGSGSLQGSLTNLSESWIETSGGDNSVTLLASISLKHTFTKNSFSLESAFSSKFGYYRVVLENTDSDGAITRDPVWYKNQDEFLFTVTPSIKLSQNWSYGATLKFRSQFAKGYVSSASQEEYNLKSDFLAPGYLDISGGMIYNCPNPKYPVKVTLSPVALSAVYVTNSTIRENAQYSYAEHTSDPDYLEAYGVNPNLNAEYEGGSSVQVELTKSFGKGDFLKYTTTFFSFYGWMSQVTHKNIISNVSDYEEALAEWNTTEEGVQPMLTIHPTVRWENKIEIKASKYISTVLNFQLYYNRAQNLNVQTQTLLSVGLSYSFKSK